MDSYLLFMDNYTKVFSMLPTSFAPPLGVARSMATFLASASSWPVASWPAGRRRRAASMGAVSSATTRSSEKVHFSLTAKSSAASVRSEEEVSAEGIRVS